MAYGYQDACERIAEITGEAITGKLDATAALAAISVIANAAPNDPGEDWFVSTGLAKES